VEINSEKLIKLYGERIIPTKIVKEINKVELHINRQKLCFLKDKNNKHKKTGVVKIRDEIFVAKPIPEIIEASIRYFKFL
jgi:predicted RNA methylase